MKLSGPVSTDTLHVKGLSVGIYTKDYQQEFISLSDIAKYKATIRIIPSETGCEIGKPLNFSACGKSCIIQILNQSNSTGLETGWA
jgi:hypothetical protein